MTGLGVGRMRTAYPLPFVPPAGVSALMPPHSQGAERRTESRDRRTRWGLRFLVLGGLAGAAWLLTGTAAHAADRADGPTSSLLGSVVGVGDSAGVSGLRTAAAQPLEPISRVHTHHLVASVLEAPRQVSTRPAKAPASHGHAGTPIDATFGTVDHLLGKVAGPTRLIGGPAITQQLLVAATEPVTADSRTDIALPPEPDLLPQAERPERPAATPVREIPVAVPASKPIHPALRAPADAPTASVPAKHAKAVSVPAAHHRHRVVPATDPPAAAQDETPGGNGPAAPLQLHLGDVSGTPTTSGSGTSPEAGAPASLPAAIADSTMASHLLPIASDVEVPRHDAEAPTVSPD
jgi:hypothetical protein